MSRCSGWPVGQLYLLIDWGRKCVLLLRVSLAMPKIGYTVVVLLSLLLVIDFDSASSNTQRHQSMVYCKSKPQKTRLIPEESESESGKATRQRWQRLWEERNRRRPDWTVALCLNQAKHSNYGRRIDTLVNF